MNQFSQRRPLYNLNQKMSYPSDAPAGCVSFGLDDQTTSADFSVHMFLQIRSTFCFILSYLQWTLRKKYEFYFAGKDAPFRGEVYFTFHFLCLLFVFIHRNLSKLFLLLFILNVAGLMLWFFSRHWKILCNHNNINLR